MKTDVWYGRAAAEDPVYRGQLAQTLLARRRRPARERPGAPGHVVEFLKSGKHLCGVLLWKGSRAQRILDANGKEDYVHNPKIVDVSSAFVDISLAKHERVEALREIDREREELKAKIDPYELWEVVEAQDREWTLGELADLYFAGEPGPHGKAALFRALEGGRAFHRSGAKFAPRSRELVEKLKERERCAAQTEVRMREAAAWLRRVADGEDAPPPADASRATELLAAKVLFGARHPHAKQASALAKLAHFHSHEAIVDALVKVGHWGEDENLDVLRHGVPTEFDNETLAEAEASTPERRGDPRLWFRRVYAFSETGRRHGRAISVRPGVFGFTVGVHFASPALVVQRGGLAQRAAADRATAIHLPDRLIPMLPKAIIERADLNKSELRPGLTLHLRFNRRFKLKAHRFEVCRARVNRPLSTEEADARIESDWGLRKLYGLAGHLRQERVGSGAIVLREPEIDVRVVDDQIQLRRADPDSPVRLICEELTILANTLAGRLCVDKGLPAIYRAEDRCPRVFVDPDRHDPVACYHQKRVMPKAALQTEPAAHHGLGVDAYAPISSPHARYADLLMHQQIIDFLDHGEPPYSDEDLEEALLYTFTARTTAREIEFASRRYWLLRYLESRIGDDVQAVVLERVGSGCKADLTETGLRVFCQPGPGPAPAPGTRVRARLARVSARADEIRLQLVDSEHSRRWR